MRKRYRERYILKVKESRRKGEKKALERKV